MNLGNLLSASAEQNPRKTTIVLEARLSLTNSWNVQPSPDGSSGRAASRGLHHARALSIIESQIPLDFRMSSTVSRIAPCPANAFVV
jgi:hypothetical protein